LHNTTGNTASIGSSLLAMMAAPFHQVEQLIRTNFALIARAPANTSNASNSRERERERERESERD